VLVLGEDRDGAFLQLTLLNHVACVATVLADAAAHTCVQKLQS
jgi:hypothetical protein